MVFSISPSSTMLRLALWISMTLAMVSETGAAEVKTRRALVIGNARYEPAAGPLRNTSNDAKAVAQTLRDLGFAVMERHNLTRDNLIKTVEEFRKTLTGAEIGLFYYAGHGVAIAGSNYLIPIKSGFDPAGADDLSLRMLAETHLFNAEQAVAGMSAAGAPCNLVILDACRNTPLIRNTRTRSTAGRSGLAEMTPPAGSLIAFSTDAGHVASDGDGANGLYTEELLKYMRAPGLTIEQVFKRTRAGVLARSDGAQVPAEYSRLIGDDIYLAGTARPEPTVLRAEAANSTDPDELANLAAEGKSAECVKGLELLTKTRGPGEYTLLPLEALLRRAKNDLENATTPSPKVIAAEESCASVLRILPECLPPDSPQAAALSAKAHNRRGDALLILGRAEEALKEFHAAQPLAPADAYILYNRGRAREALGNKDQARADYTAASDKQLNQPGARKLALQALKKLGE